MLNLDLAGSPVRPPVNFMKLVARATPRNGNDIDWGVAVTAIQALNFVPPTTDARAVTIIASETVSGKNFGRIFLDNPPIVLLETGGAQTLRQGQTTTLRVAATDDLGIVSRSAVGNGTNYVLDANGAPAITRPAWGDSSRKTPAASEVAISIVTVMLATTRTTAPTLADWWRPWSMQICSVRSPTS